MALQAIHESLEEIPSEYQSLYSERNGQFELTGIVGVKTSADVERVQVGLNKEREEHKVTKAKLRAWGEMDPEETIAKLDRITELEAAAAGSIDETKMNELVEARVKTVRAPLERQVAALTSANEELSEQVGNFEKKERRRTIHDAVRKACVDAKVLDTAHEDALILSESMFDVREDDGQIITRDNVGVTPGITAKDWLSEMQSKRPHWWPASSGGGAGGSSPGGAGGENNPWSTKNWNLTKQGQYLKEHGTEKTQATAKAAGSFLGAIAPPAEK